MTDSHNRLTRLHTAVARSEHGDCDLLVCPELFLSGYSPDEPFADLAEPANGPFARDMADVARSLGCAIVYGYPERFEGRVYNSAQCIGPDGQRLANHRKTLLPHDHERRQFTAGNRATVLQLAGWRVGLLICYEIEFPESARFLTRMGCDLLVVPTALTRDWPVVAERVIATRAFENNVFIAYANHAGADGELAWLGGSVIASPHGTDIVRAGKGEETITATLDSQMIAQARSRLPFHDDVDRSIYNRP